MVICEMLDIDFLWSSDSDTYVFPNSLEQTIATIAGDESIGGASSSLVVHNTDDTVCTKLGSAIYWCELYVTRSSPASLGSSDCQSGPCSAFRVELLRGVLLPWYNQKVWGKRMVSCVQKIIRGCSRLTFHQVINEDRHLTTSLIARGWKIAFASDVLAETETPDTVARWIGQQVRDSAHVQSGNTFNDMSTGSVGTGSSYRNVSTAVHLRAEPPCVLLDCPEAGSQSSRRFCRLDNIHLVVLSTNVLLDEGPAASSNHQLVLQLCQKPGQKPGERHALGASGPAPLQCYSACYPSLESCDRAGPGLDYEYACPRRKSECHRLHA